MTFGQNLKRLRRAKGDHWTQEHLARKAGLSVYHISRLESREPGKQGPSMNTLRRLAKALGVDARDLMP